MLKHCLIWNKRKQKTIVINAATNFISPVSNYFIVQMGNPEPISEVDDHRGYNSGMPDNDDQTFMPEEHNGLEALDDTGNRPSWRQIRLLLISSTGFFMDAYVLFNMTML
jgi:hypothetical protein